MKNVILLFLTISACSLTDSHQNKTFLLEEERVVEVSNPNEVEEIPVFADTISSDAGILRRKF